MTPAFTAITPKSNDLLPESEWLGAVAPGFLTPTFAPSAAPTSTSMPR